MHEAQRNRVYIPLLGVRCALEGLVISKSTLVLLEGPGFAGLQADMTAMYGNFEVPPGPAKEHRDALTNQIDRLRGTSALRYESEHPSLSHARQAAALDARRSLAFFRLFAAFQFSELQDPVIDFSSNYDYDFHEPFSLAGRSDSVLILSPRMPGENELLLSEDTSAKFYALGLDQVIKMYDPSARLSQFDQLILNALDWFSSASIPMKLENRFLNYITSLEMFLNVGDAPIAQNVSEGAALILADSLEDRKDIRKAVRDLYKKRNAITHGGNTGVSIEDVLALKSVCKSFLLFVIGRRTFFNTRDEFISYISDTRLSGTRPF